MGAKANACALWVSVLATHAATAHAQQFVLIDAEYTATADNTDDSHYRVEPEASIPEDWRAPVDYASGKIYVSLDILEKPSDAPTLYNICFETDGKAACMAYPPAYTAPRHLDFNQSFESLWNSTVVPWDQGVDKVALILKDADQKKKQGDPEFYPTKVHVVITVVAPGSKYDPPTSPSQPAAAGSGGAGGRAGGAGKAGGEASHAGASGGAGHAAGSGSSAGHSAAGTASAGTHAGGAGAAGFASAGRAGTVASAGTSAPAAAGTSSTSVPPATSSSASDSGGCSVSDPHGAAIDLSWLALAGSFMLARIRRIRRPRSAASLQL